MRFTILLGVCVADSPVGLDAESLSRTTRKDILQIAERRFSEREYRLLRDLPSEEERRRMFLHLWTLKESFLKASGVGISSTIGLKNCAFGKAHSFHYLLWDHGNINKITLS